MNNYYKRDIEAAVTENLSNNKALIITGMRRVGKTTLLRKIFGDIRSENKIWFDFENPLDIKYFEDIDYNGVYQNLIGKGLNKNQRMYVFIDEVQNYPEISKIAKYLIDHYDIKFILTGSASYYLKNLFPESLAGRKILFELYPLNFKEFLLFKKNDAENYNRFAAKKTIKEIEYKQYDKLYEEFINWGAFPEVVLENNLETKRKLLEDIFSSYFQKEIVNLADYRKINKIRDLILLLSARTGSRLDLTKLSQELQLTRKTVYSYLSFLEATYFIHSISRFSKNIDRQISGTQKIYFCDNGILKIISQMAAGISRISEGQLFENAVYNQLKTKGMISYYKSAANVEIDFILNKETAYEAKITATSSDINHLKRMAKRLKLKNFYVISRNYIQEDKDVVFAQFL